MRLTFIASISASVLLSSSCGYAKRELNDRINVEITKKEERNDPRSGCETSPELYKYVTMFENAYGKSIGDIPVCLGITTSKDKENVVGLCRTWSGRTRKYHEVTVSEKWYKQNHNNYFAVRQLIEHELGHCALDRGHIEEIDANSKPVSIMYPYTFSDKYYQDNHEYYLDELFNR